MPAQRGGQADAQGIQFMGWPRLEIQKPPCVEDCQVQVVCKKAESMPVGADLRACQNF